MIKYIDCDGVILDTETGLFNEYYELLKTNPTLKVSTYLELKDWNYWLRQASILNDAIYLLNNSDPKSTHILTKVHSLKEASEKLKFFREKQVENNIIIVPACFKKNEVVSAEGNILVDDNLSNLDDWQSDKGVPIYFGQHVSFYPRVASLENVLDDEKLKLLLK